MHRLPNLELLEYKCKQYLQMDESWVDSFKKKKTENKFLQLDLDCIVFPQVWGSTATAFGGIGGSAMTKAYTVVFSENNTDTHVVFVDDRPCYLVTEPKDAFYEDLKRHSMADMEEAKGRY